MYRSETWQRRGQTNFLIWREGGKANLMTRPAAVGTTLLMIVAMALLLAGATGTRVFAQRMKVPFKIRSTRRPAPAAGATLVSRSSCRGVPRTPAREYD